MYEFVEALLDIARLKVVVPSTRNSSPVVALPEAKENVPDPKAPGLVIRRTPRLRATAPVKLLAALLSVQSAMPDLATAVAPEVLSPMLPAKRFAPALPPVRVSVLAPTPLTSRFWVIVTEFAAVSDEL